MDGGCGSARAGNILAALVGEHEQVARAHASVWLTAWHVGRTRTRFGEIRHWLLTVCVTL